MREGYSLRACLKQATSKQIPFSVASFIACIKSKSPKSPMSTPDNLTIPMECELELVAVARHPAYDGRFGVDDDPYLPPQLPGSKNMKEFLENLLLKKSSSADKENLNGTSGQAFFVKLFRISTEYAESRSSLEKVFIGLSYYYIVHYRKDQVSVWSTCVLGKIGCLGRVWTLDNLTYAPARVTNFPSVPNGSQASKLSSIASKTVWLNAA